MRILFHAGGLHQWKPTDPSCFWRDIPSPAGTELGIFGYAKALRELGHTVSVVMQTTSAGYYDGVMYLSPDHFTLEKDMYDVIVSVHYAHLFTDRWAPLQCVLALSHHLVGLEQVPPQNIDRYLTPSHWGKSRLMANHPSAPVGKFWVTRIGDWLERYGWNHLAGKVWTPPRNEFDSLWDGRDPKHLVWASSPDRGLWHMVAIMKLLPDDYRLTVAYDYDNFLKRSDHIPTLLTLRKALPLKQMSNVEFVGHLSQPKLVELFKTAGMLVYPGDVPETYAITINNACAAGLPAIVSHIGGFPENYGGAVITMAHPVDPVMWAAVIQQLAEYPEGYRAVQERELQLASLTDFSEVGKEWEQFFTSFLSEEVPLEGEEMDKGLSKRRQV